MLKLITLNVELDRHWNTIIPFLEREAPDVLCLQECFASDAKMIAERFSYDYIHLPMAKMDSKEEGIAMFSKTPIKDLHSAYYYKTGPELPTYKHGTTAEKRATRNQGVIWGTIEKDGISYNLATTHFTWTPDGNPNENQDHDIQSLLKILNDIPQLVFCGDFNVPRGADNYIYKILAKRFNDNIPPAVITTLDIPNHRVRHNPVESIKLAKFVVDYIFSTPEYIVSDVQCVNGVSDHCAIAATISHIL